MELFSPLKNAFGFYADYWWLILPVFLAVASVSSWIFYKTQSYLLSLQWILLEVKPPPDVQKSPKIAESLFAALHSSYLPVKWKKRFFKGEVPNWYALEIVSNGGDMNFYVRVKADLRTLVEHAIFAQYPDAEIKVVDDYISQLPPAWPPHPADSSGVGAQPAPDYDLFGADLIFTKEDAYPIKTYPAFEEESGKDEFKRSDPLAPLAEALAALEPGEHIWLQFLIRPTGGAWAERAKAVVDKLSGKTVKPPANLLHSIMDWAEQSVGQLVSGIGPAEAKKEEPFNVQRLTPGQRYGLEQVEYKLMKLGFKSNIRFIYLSRKDLFHRAHVSSVIGMFKQLYSNNLNTFKPDPKTITVTAGFMHWLFLPDKSPFKPWQEARRKRRVYRAYRLRAFRKKVMILNTEELATLWHLPGIGVKAPGFPRVEAKKGQPPAGLPT